MKHKYSRLSFFLVAFLTANMSVNAQITMNIDATKRGPMVSPYQYGLFFEEINHAGDGGLYAEMVRNRSFEEDLNGWSSVNDATISILKTSLLNDAQTQALSINTSGASATNLKGVANEGYWGVSVVKDSLYHLSFYAKGNTNYKGTIIARLVSGDGNTILAEATADGDISLKGWSKMTATLKATESDKKAQLQILTSYPAMLRLDMVSLFPYTWKNRPNGLRPDLAQLLADTKPSFLRFPGGCYVEGMYSLDNTFQWKKTIGPIEERPGHQNFNWGYRSTDGLGFDEYLQLCEDMNCAPLFVVNIGLGHNYTIDISELQPLVQDVLDAIEYANGDATTEWGAKRIANGHAEPYNLKFIEIGNENYQADANAQSEEYAERYYMFYKAIKEKYPEITCIGNVEAWGTDYPTWRNDYPVEIVDEHYYRSNGWMKENYNKYDGYPRTIGVYNGEYAANESGTYGTYGNMNSALGEAVYMLGMEKNSDVCKMASFAPIFMNEQDPCWPYDMIHFNAADHFETPSYQVQKLLANNLGEQNLLWTESGNTAGNGDNCKVGLGSWNTAVSYDDVQVTDLNGNPIASDDFSADKNQWTFGTGTWSADNGDDMEQAELSTNCTAVLNVPVNGNYIYKVRARKNSGYEGFLIMFNYQDANNYAWWNIGGWTNTQHAVENCVNGTKTTVASASGSVTTGDWYDIEIKVEDGHVTCSMNGSVVHDFTMPTQQSQRAVYQSVQIDETTGELILKVVNPYSGAKTIRLNASNMQLAGGKVIRLAANDGTAENSMDNPDNVQPVEETIATTRSYNSSLYLEIPAYSLNIFRIKADNIGQAVEQKCEEYEKEDADKYGYLYAHMHTTQEITCYALSKNANYWRDLFNSGEAFDTKKYTSTGGMRDAFAYRTQNNKFMLAGTDMTSNLGWTSNHLMTIMVGNDLVHWDKWISIDLESAENLKALGLTNASQMSAAWAPQIIYDPVTKKYVVYYSVGFPDRHRIYYSLIDEDLNVLSEPKLFFDPGYDVIDADIVWNDVDKHYVMIYKREGDRALSMATADYLVPAGDKTTGNCQWNEVEDFYVSESGQSIEAPTQLRFIGNKTWKLAYQKYSGGYNYRLMDMDEHSLNPVNRTDIQGSLNAQHGSFVKLTEREYKHLECWERVVNLLVDAKKFSAATNNEAVAQAITKAENAINNNGTTFSDNEKAMQEAESALENVVDMDKLKETLLKEAKAGNAVDLTPLIENADFSDGSNGWTKDSAFTQANGKVAEYWNTNFLFYQTIDGLPAGAYEVGVQSFYRMGNIYPALAALEAGTYELNANLFASVNSENVGEYAMPIMSLYDSSITNYTTSPYTFPDNVAEANSAFNENGLYKNTLSVTLDKEGYIKFGIKKTAYVDGDWCCFDNFTLKYLGNPDAIDPISTSINSTINLLTSSWFTPQGQLILNPKGYKGLMIGRGKKIIK